MSQEPLLCDDSQGFSLKNRQDTQPCKFYKFGILINFYYKFIKYTT